MEQELPVNLKHKTKVSQSVCNNIIGIISIIIIIINIINQQYFYKYNHTSLVHISVNTAGPEVLLIIVQTAK